MPTEVVELTSSLLPAKMKPQEEASSIVGYAKTVIQSDIVYFATTVTRLVVKAHVLFMKLSN